MQYDFIIEYQKGKENKVADALSRFPVAELAALTLSSIQTDLLTVITQSWELDTNLTALIQTLKEGTEVQGYTFIHDQLRRNGKLVIGPDPKLRKNIM